MICEGSVLIIITFAAVSACIIEGIYIAKRSVNIRKAIIQMRNLIAKNRGFR